MIFKLQLILRGSCIVPVGPSMGVSQKACTATSILTRRLRHEDCITFQFFTPTSKHHQRITSKSQSKLDVIPVHEHFSASPEFYPYPGYPCILGILCILVSWVSCLSLVFSPVYNERLVLMNMNIYFHF